jgi:hypothetical protein
VTIDFLTAGQLKACDDALRLLLISGALTAGEVTCLVGLRWRLQQTMIDRTAAS